MADTNQNSKGEQDMETDFVDPDFSVRGEAEEPKEPQRLVDPRVEVIPNGKRRRPRLW